MQEENAGKQMHTRREQLRLSGGRRSQQTVDTAFSLFLFSWPSSASCSSQRLTPLEALAPPHGDSLLMNSRVLLPVHPSPPCQATNCRQDRRAPEPCKSFPCCSNSLQLPPSARLTHTRLSSKPISQLLLIPKTHRAVPKEKREANSVL